VVSRLTGAFLLPCKSRVYVHVRVEAGGAPCLCPCPCPRWWRRPGALPPHRTTDYCEQRRRRSYGCWWSRPPPTIEEVEGAMVQPAVGGGVAVRWGRRGVALVVGGRWGGPEGVELEGISRRRRADGKMRSEVEGGRASEAGCDGGEVTCKGVRGALGRSLSKIKCPCSLSRQPKGKLNQPAHHPRVVSSFFSAIF
jgi:hypothetical protein